MDDAKSVSGAGRRTLKLLEHIAEQSPEFTLSELAAALGLPPSTVHRLLQSFVDLGMIERTGDRAYRTGTELYRVAALIAQNFDLGPLARPALEALWAQWRETVTFSIYRPATGTGAILEIIRSPNPLQFSWDRFDEVDLVFNPNGQAMLAFLPEAEIAQILKNAPAKGPLSGAPKPTRKALQERLETVRARGCAFLQDAETLNLAGVAAPVFRAGGGLVGSIGIVMPATRFEAAREAELRQSLIDAARTVSAALGHTG